MDNEVTFLESDILNRNCIALHVASRDFQLRLLTVLIEELPNSVPLNVMEFHILPFIGPEGMFTWDDKTMKMTCPCLELNFTYFAPIDKHGVQFLCFPQKWKYHVQDMINFLHMTSVSIENDKPSVFEACGLGPLFNYTRVVGILSFDRVCVGCRNAYHHFEEYHSVVTFAGDYYDRNSSNFLV